MGEGVRLVISGYVVEWLHSILTLATCDEQWIRDCRDTTQADVEEYHRVIVSCVCKWLATLNRNTRCVQREYQ
jgi:hypothetical protein